MAGDRVRERPACPLRLSLAGSSMATGQGARRLKRESADFDVSDGGAGRGWQGAGSLVESRGGGARCGYPTADARGVSAPPCASAISALGAGSRVMAMQNTEST